MKIDQRSILRAGGGRGFVIEVDRRRLVVTAGHCLPHIPPSDPAAYSEERTYANLLGTLGAEPTVWAECLFVDPISDLAVLGTVDNQELPDEADAYDDLVESGTPLWIGSLTFTRKRHTLSDGTKFSGPSQAESPARLLSLACRWFACRVKSTGHSLWIEKAAEGIAGGMSGSPILTPDGVAIGVVCVAGGAVGKRALDDLREGGPNPLLSASLPGWITAPGRLLGE